MSHRSVNQVCQQGHHSTCTGWVDNWDTPGQRACACACHDGKLKFRRNQPVPALTLWRR